jgi:hypothetical protein
VQKLCIELILTVMGDDEVFLTQVNEDAGNTSSYKCIKYVIRRLIGRVHHLFNFSN